MTGIRRPGSRNRRPVTYNLRYVKLGVRMEAPRTAAELGQDRCRDGAGAGELQGPDNVDLGLGPERLEGPPLPQAGVTASILQGPDLRATAGSDASASVVPGEESPVAMTTEARGNEGHRYTLSTGSQPHTHGESKCGK